MFKITLLSILFCFIFFGGVYAEKASTLTEAQQLSRQTGKPILMEFVHED